MLTRAGVGLQCYARSLQFTRHALLEMARRGLSEETVREVAERPQQVVPAYGETMAHQSIVYLPAGDYLVRVVVAIRADAVLVVTAYRTSKVSKYWRQQ